MADVVLEVLDARDPLGTRCVEVEQSVMSAGSGKKLILLLNKIGGLCVTSLSSQVVYLIQTQLLAPSSKTGTG